MSEYTRAFCRCGAIWTGTDPALRALFESGHRGVGHGPASAGQAREAQRRTVSR